MKNKPEPDSDLILYQTEDGRTRVQVRLQDETVWLTQKLMAELFQTSVPNVSMHIRNVFAEGELQADSVVKEFLTTAADGKSYATQLYNLDVIISVGYRVKSLRGTQFRIWATQRLREYIVKGFTLDDERLKNPPGKGHIDYFDWVTRLHDFLNLNERAILPDAGKVSRDKAHQSAEAEYERFAARRREALEAQGEADLLGLLDVEVKKLPKKPKPPKP